MQLDDVLMSPLVINIRALIQYAVHLRAKVKYTVAQSNVGTAIKKIPNTKLIVGKFSFFIYCIPR